MERKHSPAARAWLAWAVVAASSAGIACGPATARTGAQGPGPRTPIASISAADERVRLVEGEYVFNDVNGQVPCWSFATEGLAAFGQKEIVFFVRRDAGITLDHARNDLTLFAALVVEMASQGRLVDVRGFSEMGDGLLGRRNFSGVLYTAPQPMDGLALPQPHLIAILVTPEELRIAREFGHQRITARLGLQSRYYPLPPWADPNRRSVAEAGDSTTLLDGAPRLFLDGYVQQDVSADKAPVVLELAPDAAQALAGALAELSEDLPLSLLLRTSDSWDGMLVWRPGVEGIEGINPEGGAAAVLGGNHLTFIPEEGAEAASRILEDGYAVRLGSDDWRSVRSALASGEALVVGSPPVLEIRWRREVAVSQVDGTEYRAEGGWRRAQPEHYAAPVGRLEMSLILLLLPDYEVSTRVGVEPFSAYITALREAVAPVVEGADKTARNLAFRIILQPGKVAECTVGLNPGDAALEAALAAACAGVAAPAVTGDVPFELQFRILEGEEE